MDETCPLCTGGGGVAILPAINERVSLFLSLSLSLSSPPSVPLSLHPTHPSLQRVPLSASLAQPLWHGEDWGEFHHGYESARHNLDAWLARTIARDNTVDALACLGPAPTQPRVSAFTRVQQGRALTAAAADPAGQRCSAAADGAVAGRADVGRARLRRPLCPGPGVCRPRRAVVPAVRRARLTP